MMEYKSAYREGYILGRRESCLVSVEVLEDLLSVIKAQLNKANDLDTLNKFKQLSFVIINFTFQLKAVLRQKDNGGVAVDPGLIAEEIIAKYDEAYKRLDAADEIENNIQKDNNKTVADSNEVRALTEKFNEKYSEVFRKLADS